MSFSSPRLSGVLSMLVLLCTAAWPQATPARQTTTAAPSPESAAERAPLPDWPAAAGLSWAVLESKKKYQRDDLITATDVRAVLAALEAELGWKVPQQDKLLERTVSESDFLVRQLYSKRGLKFMRRVSSRDGVYDQFDRLARLPGGERMIRDLINRHNGVAVVDYYFDHAERGINLTELLPRQGNGRPPQDKDFRKPTGRIYTGKSLVDHLKIIYDAQVKAIAEAALEAAEQEAANAASP